MLKTCPGKPYRFHDTFTGERSYIVEWLAAWDNKLHPLEKVIITKAGAGQQKVSYFYTTDDPRQAKLAFQPAAIK